MGYNFLVPGFIPLTLSVACLSSSFDQRLFSTAIFSKKTHAKKDPLACIGTYIYVVRWGGGGGAGIGEGAAAIVCFDVRLMQI